MTKRGSYTGKPYIRNNEVKHVVEYEGSWECLRNFLNNAPHNADDGGEKII